MAKGMLAASLLSILFPAALGFCPAGFGPSQKHPSEWKIPTWPSWMSEEEAGKLAVVKLGGFNKAALNEEYLEGPTEAFSIQGKKTYWQASGDYFMYFCIQYRKWRISHIQAFGENKNGQCYSFCSDGYPSRDVQNKSLIKGWIEVVDGQWVVLPKAGVVKLTTLQEQMDEAEEGDECDDDTNEENPFAEKGAPKKKKQKESKCPVTRTYNKVKSGIKSIGKWVKRLFPKLLGAPEPDEEEEYEEEAADGTIKKNKRKVKQQIDKWKAVEKKDWGLEQKDETAEKKDAAADKKDGEKKTDEL